MRDTQPPPNDWSALVEEIMKLTGWSQTRLADEIGVNRRTVKRYIDGETENVTRRVITSVTDAAHRAGIDPQRVAATVARVEAEMIAEDDALIRDILEDPDAPDFVKQQAIARVRDRRRENEEAIRRDVDLLLRSHRPQPES